METQVTVQNQHQASREFNRKLLMLAGAGSAAFWIVDFAMALSPIAEAYRAAFSINDLPLALVQALMGGVMIGGCVSYLLLRFADRVPVRNPIGKAVILSLAAMLLVEALTTLADPGNAFTYLVIDTGMNLPRFLALGLATGYRYALFQ